MNEAQQALIGWASGDELEADDWRERLEVWLDILEDERKP